MDIQPVKQVYNPNSPHCLECLTEYNLTPVTHKIRGRPVGVIYLCKNHIEKAVGKKLSIKILSEEKHDGEDSEQDGSETGEDNGGESESS